LTTEANEVLVSAPGEYYLLEKAPEAARIAVHGQIHVRVEQKAKPSTEIFRVQVASFSRPQRADELRQKLRQVFTLPLVVRENPATRTYQVRIGEFAVREEAQLFASKTLVKAGYSKGLVVREAARAGDGSAILALRGPDELFRVNTSGYFVFPASGQAFLSLAGRPYRGILDLSLNTAGRVTVVNQLSLEEYLLGVVPAEISPSTYPEIAALSAQSIAARTYALKNAGRFRSEGFDLTADVRSQVYGGAALERPLTNEAVRETFGLAIYYRGSLIDAMYTAVCGGRTEDFSKVFDAPDVPYLRSVACTMENGASDDQFPPQAAWQATLARSVVAEKLRPLVSGIGELKDLRPVRFGSSGRAVKIQAIGTRGSAILNGYKVRNALGLRDTLFTVSRRRHPDGRVESLTFDGSGWGHGVGMCQVGAFGMARAGYSYQEILKTYYHGVEIGRAY